MNSYCSYLTGGDWHAAESMLPLALQHVLHRVLRAEDVGVQDKAMLVLFDLGDLGRLVLGCAVVMNDANASAEGHGDSHL